MIGTAIAVISDIASESLRLYCLSFFWHLGVRVISWLDFVIHTDLISCCCHWRYDEMRDLLVYVCTYMYITDVL